MIDLSLFRFAHAVEIRYADLDALAHVNNAKYFTYMETARGCVISARCSDGAGIATNWV